jgi:hypothetical protein
MKNKFVITLVIFLLCLPRIAMAWNELAHMVIADIAYDRLNPVTRAEVDQLQRAFAQEYPSMNSVALMASWPDELHAPRVETFSHWHYIDNAFSSDGTALKNLSDTDNAVWALKNIVNALNYTKGNRFERARFLAFFMHIVGDLHQPLHTVSRISAEHPDGDAGGNLFVIRFNHETTNLHRLWDDGADDFSGSTNPQLAETLAKVIIQNYPPTYFGNAVNDLNVDDWLSEGMNSAVNEVYHTSENRQPSRKYLKMLRKTAVERVALAGYRLANWLNSMNLASDDTPY